MIAEEFIALVGMCLFFAVVIGSLIYFFLFEINRIRKEAKE